MNLNLTLIGQMITFGLFVWFTMKYVWPPMLNILHGRQKTIADGLAAAEKGQKELELAEHKAVAILTEAKAKAAHILEQANQRANHIVEESKSHARTEGARLLSIANADIEREYHSAKSQLMTEVSGMVIAATEKILQKEVDQESNVALVDELVGEL